MEVRPDTSEKRETSVFARHGYTPSASPKVLSIMMLGVAILATPAGPASAEGFFDFLFGGAPKQAASDRLTPQTSSICRSRR